MNRLGIVSGALAAIAALTFSGTSHAADANGLGQKGELIITADRLFPLFSYTSASTTFTQNNTTTTDSVHGTSLVLLYGDEPSVSTPHTTPRVAFDYTIIDRLTLGGAVVLAFGLGATDKTETVAGSTTTTREVDAPHHTLFGIGPRVGYILPLGDILAFWPRGGFTFYSDRTRQETPVNANTTRIETSTDTLFSIDLDPQLAIVPMEHFFFHVGPLMNIPLSGSRKVERTEGATTTSVSNDLSVFHFGISAGLGGWFNL